MKKGSEHSEETRLKISRATKGKKNPMFGKKNPKVVLFNKQRKGIFKHTLATREKISKSLTGKYYIEITKEKLIKMYQVKRLSLSQISEKTGFSICALHNALKRFKIPILHNNKASGKDAPMFGKAPSHSKGVRYKGCWMRSLWEYNLAKWLDKNEMRWKYEPKRFYFENGSYLPDFWVEDWNCYIEIKGWLDERSREQIDNFKKYYPMEKLVIFDCSELKKLKIGV